jgi:predicted nucleic acid-binding protein
MDMILLDTNTIIYYFQGKKKTTLLLDDLRKKGEQFIISTITELELLSFPDSTPEEIIKIHLFLQTLYTIPVDSVIARHAAQLRKEYHLKTPDAIIAATAQTYGGRILSDDTVFKRIKNITLMS